MDIISVFIQNRPGRLSQIIQEIASPNIFGFSIADAGEFGIVRLCVENPKEAVSELKRHDLIAHVTDVVAVHQNDLLKVVELFDKRGVNIDEALYAVLASQGPLAIFKVQDAELARSVLTEESIEYF